MSDLTIVGLWEEEDGEEDWPHPRCFARASPIPDIEKVVGYLQSGIRIFEDLGYSYCRFEGGPPDEQMGNAELSDGEWVWPEGLAVYVQHFSVDLPKEFLDHMAHNEYRVPEGLNSQELESREVTFEFWRTWTKGYGLTSCPKSISSARRQDI